MREQLEPERALAVEHREGALRLPETRHHLRERVERRPVPGRAGQQALERDPRLLRTVAPLEQGHDPLDLEPGLVGPLADGALEEGGGALEVTQRGETAPLEAAQERRRGVEPPQPPEGVPRPPASQERQPPEMRRLRIGGRVAVGSEEQRLGQPGRPEPGREPPRQHPPGRVVERAERPRAAHGLERLRVPTRVVERAHLVERDLRADARARGSAPRSQPGHGRTP